MSHTYFRVDTCATADRDCCFFEAAPSGTEMTCFKLAKGIAIGDEYPSDAELRMTPDEPGMVVPGVVSNTRALLIVDAPLRDAIEGLQSAETEYLPLTIRDHKGRVASDHHWIVNPIDTVDCADLDASDIEWFEGDVVEVEELVLDATKLEKAPALLRPREQPRTYLVRTDLADALRALSTRNLWLEELKTTLR